MWIGRKVQQLTSTNSVLHWQWAWVLRVLWSTKSRSVCWPHRVMVHTWCNACMDLSEHDLLTSQLRLAMGHTLLIEWSISRIARCTQVQSYAITQGWSCLLVLHTQLHRICKWSSLQAYVDLWLGLGLGFQFRIRVGDRVECSCVTESCNTAHTQPGLATTYSHACNVTFTIVVPDHCYTPCYPQGLPTDFVSEQQRNLGCESAQTG